MFSYRLRRMSMCGRFRFTDPHNFHCITREGEGMDVNGGKFALRRILSLQDRCMFRVVHVYICNQPPHAVSLRAMNLGSKLAASDYLLE